MNTPPESSLDFFIFERPVHPELFTIYASRRFFQGDYEALIWITGSSHVVSVFLDGQCMTEIIGLHDQLLPSKGLIERFQFKRDRTYEKDWPNGMGYQTSFQAEGLSDGLYERTLKDLKTMGKKRGMLVTHPQSVSQKYPSVSYLDYEARVEELHIHTFHLLNDPQMVIKSQSLFRVNSQWVKDTGSKSRRATS